MSPGIIGGIAKLQSDGVYSGCHLYDGFHIIHKFKSRNIKIKSCLSFIQHSIVQWFKIIKIISWHSFFPLFQ